MRTRLRLHLCCSLACVVLVLQGCSRPKTHTVGFGKQPIPKSTEHACYAMQYNQQGPVFVIVWKSDMYGGYVESDSSGRLSKINGRTVDVNAAWVGGVFLLQGDYTVTAMSLTQEDAEEMLRILRSQLPTPNASLMDSKIWKVNIEPQLNFVPSPAIAPSS